MPDKNYKLGRDIDDMLSSPETKKLYPTFFIEGDEPLDLPHSGTMTIKFKKTASSTREDEDGDLEYSCTVEVHEIVDAYSDEPEAPARNRNKGTEDALEAGRSAQMAKRKKSVDY